MAEYQTIEIERRGAIEILSLNRPDRLNALSYALVAELNTYLDRLALRPEIRVVLLRGNGRAFCAGVDVKEFGEASDETPVLRTYRTQIGQTTILRKMRALPQPFIALAQGPACGAGFSLLLAADVRYGAPDLRMNAAYVNIGLGGCDLGASYFLPRLIGASIAAELILTGRFLHADRALALGLLSGVVEQDRLLETGLALAAEMLATAPAALRLTKQALNLNIDAPSLDMAMAIEDRQQVLLSATADHREAMTAFAEKRTPAYMDR